MKGEGPRVGRRHRIDQARYDDEVVEPSRDDRRAADARGGRTPASRQSIDDRIEVVPHSRGPARTEARVIAAPHAREGPGRFGNDRGDRPLADYLRVEPGVKAQRRAIIGPS